MGMAAGTLLVGMAVGMAVGRQAVEDMEPDNKVLDKVVGMGLDSSCHSSSLLIQKPSLKVRMMMIKLLIVS